MLLLIANDAPLGPEWLDHPLQGEWSDHRECHVGGDFLVTYRLGSSDADSPVTFVRAGTHADLFTKATSLMRNTVREYPRGDGIENASTVPAPDGAEQTCSFRRSDQAGVD